MLRLFARSAFSRPPWSRQHLSRTSLARILLGVSGFAYYVSTVKVIHSDTNSSDSQNDEHKWISDQNTQTRAVGLLKFFESHAKNRGYNESLLRDTASSISPSEANGITRYDAIVVPSNYPSEDYISTAICRLPGQTWGIFAVFDGHNGPQTSSLLSQNLIEAVVGALADLFSKYEPIPEEHTELGTISGRPHPPPEAIDGTIKDTFKRIDDDIVNGAAERALSEPSKETAINLLAAAHAGSCAILAFYDSDTRLLRVAVTGDSRAVLGRRTQNERGQDSYEVHVLSADQNAHNPAEEARMNALHPGEKIMENGRVLGWGMSRAFGDAAFKWSQDIQQRLHQEYLGDPLRPTVKTPPYFTAEPEITMTEVQPGDFLVLGSDGLWDCLTNEEVVGLVGLWLTKYNPAQQHTEGAVGNLPSDADFERGVERDELPVKLKGDKTPMYRWWRAKKRFVNVDDNVASHLARNALGGADRDLTAALLSMTPPRSRHFRDDLSVNVVFFGEN